MLGLGVRQMKVLFWNALDTVRMARRDGFDRILVVEVPGTKWGIGFAFATRNPAAILFSVPLDTYDTGVVYNVLTKLYDECPDLFAEEMTRALVVRTIESMTESAVQYQLDVFTRVDRYGVGVVRIVDGLDAWEYRAPLDSEFFSAIADDVFVLTGKRAVPKAYRYATGRRRSIHPMSYTGVIGWSYCEE